MRLVRPTWFSSRLRRWGAGYAARYKHFADLHFVLSDDAGSSSPRRSVTLTSAGSAPLHLSSVTLGGSNSARFHSTSSCAAQAYVVFGILHCGGRIHADRGRGRSALGLYRHRGRCWGCRNSFRSAGWPQRIPDPITTPGSALTFTCSLVQVVKEGQQPPRTTFNSCQDLRHARLAMRRSSACCRVLSAGFHDGNGGTPYPLTITVSARRWRGTVYGTLSSPPTTLAMRFLCVLLILIAACFLSTATDAMAMRLAGVSRVWVRWSVPSGRQSCQ